MSGSRVYQGSSPQVSSGQWPGDLVLAVAGETQLLVTGSVKCLQTQSVGQAMLFFEPFAQALFRLPDYRRLAALVERREAMEALAAMIERAADEREQAREKTGKKS